MTTISLRYPVLYTALHPRPLQGISCYVYGFHDLFYSYQNKIKELELLCSLKEIPLDFSDLENVVLALRQVAQSAHTL